MMNNSGTLLANELSVSRLKALHSNLQRMGVTNCCLSHYDGSRMPAFIDEQFDAILLDAPCGGEGTLRKDPQALDNWSETSIATLSDLQFSLLDAAWQMLKPGGRLVYSTCTLKMIPLDRQQG